MESEAQRVDHPLEVELTYALGREFWGKGYASEACRAVIGFAFEELKLRRLVTGCEPENLRAMRLQERLGMRRERNVLGKFCAVVGVMDNPLFVQGPG
jgi:RimJ/RimL family protein N-acetyltransferase